MVLRTSASAQDFWSRVRHDSQVSQLDGRPVSRTFLDNSDTPFGRQNRPMFHSNALSSSPKPPSSNPSPTPSSRSPLASIASNDILSSREVEKLVLKGEINALEHSVPPPLSEIETLKTDNASLKKQVNQMQKQIQLDWKVNAALVQTIKAYTSK